MKIEIGKIYHIRFRGVEKSLERDTGNLSENVAAALGIKEVDKWPPLWDLIKVTKIGGKNDLLGTSRHFKIKNEMPGRRIQGVEQDVHAICLASSRPTGPAWIGNLELMEGHTDIREVNPEDLPLYLHSKTVTKHLAQAIKEA